MMRLLAPIMLTGLAALSVDTQSLTNQGVPRPAVGSGSTLQVLAALRALRYDPSRGDMLRQYL